MRDEQAADRGSRMGWYRRRRVAGTGCWWRAKARMTWRMGMGMGGTTAHRPKVQSSLDGVSAGVEPKGRMYEGLRPDAICWPIGRATAFRSSRPNGLAPRGGFRLYLPTTSTHRIPPRRHPWTTSVRSIHKLDLSQSEGGGGRVQEGPLVGCLCV